ncbi:monooxygenase [Penicillium hordei]|uniref:Monooxygenase n=1 Tax=Penicillium hordei TaxID=40994 RepID=A0AAD6EJ63_9EURO|nr:monooxygenase [Penicillium hordei]KAJ5617337.1 monooxygenase [Penicillium hordei]
MESYAIHELVWILPLSVQARGEMMAAIECWRKGHEVKIIEKGSDLSEAGDIVAIGPSAWSNLQKYPSMLEEWHRISIDPHTAFFYLNGELAVRPFEFEYNRPGVAQHVAYPLRVRSVFARSHLARMLYNQCERLSIPITWDVDIVAYQEDVASGVGITVSEDGRRFQADIVVAADGYTCYRMTIPAENYEQIPSLQKALEGQKRPELRIYNGHNLHVIFVVSKTVTSVVLTREEACTPTRRSQGLQNADKISIQEDAGSAVESWASTVPHGRVLAGIPDAETWDTLLTNTIRAPPKTPLYAGSCLCAIPNVNGHRQVGTSSKLAIVHTALSQRQQMEPVWLWRMVPSLAECLRRGGDGKGAAIGAKVHELLRYQRVTLIQRTGFANRRELHSPTDELPKDPQDLMRQGKWLWTHNSEAYAAENFDKARAHLESGAPFQNTNLPVGHQFEDWTLEDEVEKEKRGIVVPDLKLNGDWSVV